MNLFYACLMTVTKRLTLPSTPWKRIAQNNYPNPYEKTAKPRNYAFSCVDEISL